MTQQDIEKACGALREILQEKKMVTMSVCDPYLPSRYTMVVAKKGQTVEEVVGIFKDIEALVAAVMEKIIDKVNEMIDAREWDHDNEALLILTGNVKDGLLMGTFKGTVANLAATLVTHMLEKKEIEVIVMEAAYQFIKEMEKREGHETEAN